MRNCALLPLLACIGVFLPLTYAQKGCDVSKAVKNMPFPDIEKEADLSYMMSVEYTAPGATQTDYYMEYYDVLERKGRVDSYQAGKRFKYIYSAETFEAWELSRTECNLRNLTNTPEMMRDEQTEWLYMPPDAQEKWRIGPSAMFKYALDSWNANKGKKMVYMGSSLKTVRGLNAIYWRRCITDDAYVDYYFSADTSVFGESILKNVPLRVHFGGKREGEGTALNEQIYDILTYQPVNSLGLAAFELPTDKACRRGEWLDDLPEVPNFMGHDLMFSAEVIYRKVDWNGEDTQYWNYYSNLFMAYKHNAKHIAYHFTPWAGKKQEDEPLLPVFDVYDMKHYFLYTTDLESGKCNITRTKSFQPAYPLPENGGSIPLTDFTMLYPGPESTFVTETTNRGLKVNVFESVIDGFLLDSKNGEKISIPNAVITHSYLQDDEMERGIVATKNALVQIQIKFKGRYEKVFEIITMNFFGFSNELRNERTIFNIKRCFKNDDDYVWVTIGYHADPKVLANIEADIPSIKLNIYSALSGHTDVSPLRMPVMLVDIKEGIYVSMLILERPPVILDYIVPSETDKFITGGTDVDGMDDLDTCAQDCLEQKVNCWGFAMCGTVCAYGVGDAKVVDKVGCELYRRFDNKSMTYSNERIVDSIKEEVTSNRLNLVLRGKDGKMVQIDANSVTVSDPGENDRLFDRVGHMLNERMKVTKAGYKLKKGLGTPVSNVGRLRYDDCQKVCLDFKTCEAVSYCLTLQPTFDSQCIITDTYGDDLQPSDMEENFMCIITTRKYTDHFERVPGIVLSITAEENVKDVTDDSGCARACLKQSKFQCQSYDYCSEDKDAPCRLHTVHYPNAKIREAVQEKSSSCGHYYRKYSTEFKKYPKTRTVGSTVPVMTNMTLEECSKACYEYGKGACYGFDFCQDAAILATSCILFDKDPAQLKKMSSPICTSFERVEPQYAPLPYTNGYAGGIGFLCFLIGGLVGAFVIFGIAYMRVNRR